MMGVIAASKKSESIPVVGVLSLTEFPHSINLEWTAGTDLDGTISNVLIHRQLNGGGYSLLATIGNVLSYEDTTASTVGVTYGYKIQVKDNDGNVSLFSNSVSLEKTI